MSVNEYGSLDKTSVCLGNSNVDPIPQFKVGDVVHLKGAPYPLMTVENVTVTANSGVRKIHTVWMTPGGEIRRDVFMPEALTLK